MPIPTSEPRLTRSQVRLGKAGLSATARDAAGSPTPHKPPANAERVSKAITQGGPRRVLAELGGNDSPIIGLIPAMACHGTPSSSLKSAMGARSYARRPFALDDALPTGSTPVGESILRSQVQLLLQKVESNAPSNKQAPSLRALCHVHNFMDSPALKLAAPTPMNTPCSNAASPNISESPTIVSLAKNCALSADLVLSDDKLVQDSDISAFQGKLFLPEQAPALKLQDSGIKLFVDLNISPESRVLPQPEPSSSENQLQRAPKTNQITISESVNSGRDHQIMHVSPLISEAIHEAENSELSHLGKKTTRILQFDSPGKNAVTDLSFFPSFGDSYSSVRELEDDESSEWSVLVNVSSPAGKRDEPENSGENSVESSNALCETASSVHEHLQKNREGSNKVDLLWSDRRKATPFRRGAIEEDEEEACEECEVYFSDAEEEIEQDDDVWKGVEQYAECENLCKSFCEMTVQGEEEESKGLPRAEGTHTWFVYDSDEDETEEKKLQVNGVQAIKSSAGATVLRGLPDPKGKHFRFCEDDDGEEIEDEDVVAKEEEEAESGN